MLVGTAGCGTTTAVPGTYPGAVVELRSRTTLRIGGPAAVLSPANLAELLRTIREFREPSTTGKGKMMLRFVAYVRCRGWRPLALVVGVAIVATLAAAAATVRAFVPAPRPGQRFLLAAVDAQGLLDGMAIVSVVEGQVAVVAPPRDSLEPEGHRINSLSKRLGGLGPATQRLAELLDTSLDGYIAVDYAQLGDVLARAFPEGLQVTHPAIQYRDSHQRLVIDIPAGDWLSASAIAPYLRARHGIGDGSDLGRVRRALQLLRAGASELRRKRDIRGADRLLEEIRANCSTDLSPADLRALAAAVMRFPVRVAMLPGEPGAKGSYVLDLSLARRMVGLATSTGLPDPRVTVHVAVGADPFPRLAHKSVHLVHQAGLMRVGDVVATIAPARASTIEFGGGATRNDALALAEVLGLRPRIRCGPREGSDPWLRATLGGDFAREAS